MRNTLLTLVFTIIMSSIFGQAEKANYKTVADKFEQNYNSGNYDSIFSLFSSEMKNALPLDETKEFLTGLKTQAGQITKREFVKYQASYASYKTKFESALFAVNISVDNNLKINGLFVKPFTDESLPVIERNSTNLKLPFKDEWTVVWGGDTKELNYHVESQAQKKETR